MTPLGYARLSTADQQLDALNTDPPDKFRLPKSLRRRLLSLLPYAVALATVVEKASMSQPAVDAPAV
jgi:hypothetical protein